MCGLAAIFAYAPTAKPVDPEALRRTRDVMLKRGPDGAGEWISADGRVGLAHRRLSIIDLSEGGSQPMASADGRIRIVFNGEIYNYKELRGQLAAEGVTFRSTSDTEVILALWLRHGEAMLSRLRGMFSFVLWDENQGGVLLARDPFGIKPLYFSDDGTTLRVASQVKALLAGGGIDTRPEPAGHAGFFLWGHVPEPFTLYRGIQALPAGQALWIDTAGRRREIRHFDLTSELAQAAATTMPAAVEDALRDMIADSVQHHMIADVPVGVFLSAGLDSATLAAFATQSTAKVRTLTLGFEEFVGRPEDEVPLAETIAHLYRTDHTTARITASDFAAARDLLVADMDQPTVDGSNVWFVSRAARQAGLKVALSGLGGDEIFGGYDTFSKVPRLVKFLGPLRPLRPLGRALRHVSSDWLTRRGKAKAAGLLEYGTSLPDAYLLRRGLFMPWELGQVLDPDFAREGVARLHTESALAQTIVDIRKPRLAMTALETAWYMRNQLLRDADWAGMAHSLEIRVPLVDIDLFRAMLPLLVGAKPPGKQDMAATTAPPLPPEVLNRPKTGFTVPIARWLGEDSLRGWAKRVHSAFTPQ